MHNAANRDASLLLALLAMVAPPVLAGPGELDVRFGTHGWRDLPEMDAIAAAVPLPDGSVIVVGHKWPSGAMPVDPQPDVQVSHIDPAGTTLWTRSLGKGYSSTGVRLLTGRILVGFSSFNADRKGRIAALLENGEVDTGFGNQGKVSLERSQIVSGAGTIADAVWFSSIREMTDGSLLVGATVSNDTIPTAWDPASQGVVFRLGGDGALLDPPRQADPLLQQRYADSAQPSGDGRSLLLATNGCCNNLRGLLLSRDAAGALAETPATQDSALSLSALAYDETNRRFYALGTWNSNSVLVAGDSTGALDPSFGADGTGRVAFPLASNETAGFFVDETGSVVTFRMLPEERKIDLRTIPHAQFFVGRRNASGLPDPDIDGSVPVPMADQERRTTASNVLMAQAAAGFAWVTASAGFTELSYGPDTGDWHFGSGLAKLQLEKGSGRGTLGFQVASIRVAEQGPAQQVRVVRSGGSSGAVSVRYVVTSSSATDDLKTTSGTLTWADGDATARTIEIAAKDDNLLEGEERYSFTLVDPAGGVDIAAEPLVAIIEDDEALALLMAEARSAKIVAGQTAEFVLRLQRPVPGQVTVTALVGDSVDANGDWPLYTGKNSSGWVRQTVGWNAGDTGERVIRLPTNQNADSSYSVDLNLRLASAAGLVRQVADVGTVVVSSRVSVAGGPMPPTVATSIPSGNTSTPSVATSSPPVVDNSRSGGGSIGAWTLISLLLLFLGRRHVRREPAFSVLEPGRANT